MQDILVEHARRKLALKRGGGRRRDELSESDLIVDTSPVEMLALEQALEKLKENNSRMHTVVMLRYFAGLTENETAQALGLGRSTVARDWRVARAWLPVWVIHAPLKSAERQRADVNRSFRYRQ